MKKLLLKIEYQSSWYQRLRRQAPMLVSYLLSSALIITSIYFAGEKLVPAYREKSKLHREIQQQQRNIQQLTTKLADFKSEGPFSPTWDPRLSARLAELCDSDTQVYYRFLDQEQKRQLKFNVLHVERMNSPIQGFSFTTELSGQYSDFIQFLGNLENKFSFLQIKSMKVWPQSAENRYRGVILLRLEGWLW